MIHSVYSKTCKEYIYHEDLKQTPNEQHTYDLLMALISSSFSSASSSSLR